MAIVSIPADLSKGADPSPWTLNGNDLYTDSTSYLVGIGTTDPDKALHIKANDGAGHIQFEGSGNSFFASVETQGANQSQALKFSQTYWANAFFDFESDVTNASASADVRIIADNAQRIYFRDRVGANDLAVITSDKTRERLYIYGDDGYAGGMFTMDWAQANDARFGFGYGDEALSTAARLAVKHVSSPQLLLSDGTSSTTFQHDDNSGVPTLKMNASILEIQDAISGGGTQLVLKNNFGDSTTFKQDETGQSFNIFTDDFDFKMYSTEAAGSVGFANASGTRKVRYRNAENQFMISSGLRYDIHSTSSATYTLTTSDGRVMILADSSSNAITINLPVASENSGRIVNIKDKGGNAGTNNITIDPNGSETIDGGATVAISSNYGSMTVLCDGTSWHIFG